MELLGKTGAAAKKSTTFRQFGKNSDELAGLKDRQQSWGAVFVFL